MKKTVSTFREAKEKGEKITMLTAYDYSTAKIIDQCGVDSILVGDSLGMVMLGYENTLSVTMDDMIHHIKAVSRGAENAMIVGDMPFLSYNTGIRDAVINAGRMISEGGAHCVKLEGGKEVCDVIKAIVDAKIPVCAHIGLTPQSLNSIGGYKVQGKDMDSARKLVEDAIAVEKAGVFAVVLECVPTLLAKKISEILEIPTIGIGAGKYCDGQVLVYQDMLGIFSDFTPKFVKRFANVGDVMRAGIEEYISEVKNSEFPEDKHGFKISEEVIEKL